MRVLLCGTSAFAVPSLERLAASAHPVVLCVTQPDRPQGRGQRCRPSPVKEAAVRLGVPLVQPERLRAGDCASVQPDIGVVIAYGQLIRPDVLGLPRHGMLGLHPSLLPKYRGAAPVAWALLNGEATTGISVFRLNEQLDAGDVVLQETTSIHPDEDAEMLTQRLARQGAEVLVRALDDVAAGQCQAIPQDGAQASMAPKFTKAEGRIDWNASAQGIERLVRAVTPWPGAMTDWRGTALKIVRAHSASDGGGQAARAPGTVVHVSPEALTVATGEGVLKVTEVQLAGGRRMPVQAFLAGHAIERGARFGL